MTLENVVASFKMAKENGYKFICVCIQTEGNEGEEIIINPACNFDKKLEYYQKAYNDDLTLKSFSGIKITGISVANSFEEIEAAFIY